MVELFFAYFSIFVFINTLKELTKWLWGNLKFSSDESNYLVVVWTPFYGRHIFRFNRRRGFLFAPISKSILYFKHSLQLIWLIFLLSLSPWAAVDVSDEGVPVDNIFPPSILPAKRLQRCNFLIADLIQVFRRIIKTVMSSINVLNYLSSSFLFVKSQNHKFSRHQKISYGLRICLFRIRRFHRQVLPEIPYHYGSDNVEFLSTLNSLFGHMILLMEPSR